MNMLFKSTVIMLLTIISLTSCRKNFDEAVYSPEYNEGKSRTATYIKISEPISKEDAKGSIANKIYNDIPFEINGTIISPGAISHFTVENHEETGYLKVNIAMFGGIYEFKLMGK